jgi:hypothetical protein
MMGAEAKVIIDLLADPMSLPVQKSPPNEPISSTA